MVRILRLCGSLRAQPYNLSLLRAAAGLTDTGTELDIATMHGIPLYDANQEQRAGLPAAVMALVTSAAAGR
jgi:chromate reductase, NAD(P)H dehydrogenase (quinone)